MLLRVALAGLIVVAVPAGAVAWPAVQNALGVHLCDSRPHPQPYGLWACRSGGVVHVGDLVEVSRGPGPLPPGGFVPPGYPPAPRRGFGGYDELDPWLGGGSRR